MHGSPTSMSRPEPPRWPENSTRLPTRSASLGCFRPAVRLGRGPRTNRIPTDDADRGPSTPGSRRAAPHSPDRAPSATIRHPHAGQRRLPISPLRPSRDDPVVIFSSSFNVERNIPAEISIFRGPLFSVAVAVRVGPDQHISERVRVGWRFSLAGPVPRGRESPNGPNGLIEAFVIIEARLEGYRGLVSLRCGRRAPQSAKDPDRH